MSTVVRRPKEPIRKWCVDCPIEGELTGGRVEPTKYEPKTVIKCDDCGRLWYIKENPYSYFHEIRLLRWYHRSGWGLDRTEA